MDPSNLKVGECNYRAAALDLLGYCRGANWAGHDPYDALNSTLLRSLPFQHQRLSRLAWTQLLKRSPFDLRDLLGVPKLQNPKALALCLSASLKLARISKDRHLEDAQYLIDRIAELRSPNETSWNWGYSFPWQGRGVLVPAFAPNLVCTTFVASSLLDAYEELGATRCLEMALGAAEYIVSKLYWTEGEIASFSYPLPGLRTQVHNANLLAAALLCRVSRVTGAKNFLGPALQATEFAVSKQRSDGAWGYGEAATQKWVDNFHTGYNLWALRVIGAALNTDRFEDSLNKGYDYYCERFYLADGRVRYYDNKTYPIDIHCLAQSIITPLVLNEDDEAGRTRAFRVADWTLAHMRDPKGCYYYRKLRLATIRTSYFRWSQAWMLYALAAAAVAQSKHKGVSLQETVTHTTGRPGSGSTNQAAQRSPGAGPAEHL